MTRRSESARGVRILGIDPGTRLVGYGFLAGPSAAGRSWREVRHGRIAVRGSVEERLVGIVREIRTILAGTRPDVVALEEAFYGRDARSALRLGESRGAILVAVREQGIPVMQFPPAVVKRAVAGNGAATKEQVGSMVRRLLGPAAKDAAEDAADALAVAICCAGRSTGWRSRVLARVP